MKNILKKIVNRKVGNSEIVEVEQLNPEEEENIFLPIASDALNITEQYNQIVFFIKRYLSTDSQARNTQTGVSGLQRSQPN